MNDTQAPVHGDGSGVTESATEIVAEAQAGHVWRVEDLRLTAGYETPHPTSLLRDWWAVATGVHPATVHEEPMKGIAQVDGRTDDADLQVARVEPSRLEVAWTYDRPDPELLLVFDDACAEFMARWISFQTLPRIQRLV